MIGAGEIHEVTAVDLSVEGEGIGRIDGMAVFIPGLLTGEHARVRITSLSKKSAHAEILELLLPSPDRINPLCPYFPACGGCALQHLSYSGQLLYKRSRVESCLRKIGGIDTPVRPTLSAGEALRYRNKASFPVRGANGPRAGYFARGGGELLPVNACLLQSEEGDAILKIVQTWMEKVQIAPYDPASHRGLLRRVLIRRTAEGELMVGLIINGDSVPAGDELVPALLEANLGVKSVVLCQSRGRDADIPEGEIKVLYGSPTVRERIGGLLFEISLKTFLQVNHRGAELLYDIVLGFAALSPNDVVLDLYCGAGTISLLAARRAAQVYGVEIVEDAVKDARRNAKLNGIANAEFLCADAKEGIATLLRAGRRVDVALLDPPRRGADAGTIAALLNCRPERIVYISCDPATLARDLKTFLAGGYALRIVQPIDLFPNTTHVECVVLMSRVEK